MHSRRNQTIMFSVSNVATYLNVSEKTVRRKIKRGELVASKVGSRLRIRPEDLDAFIARNSNRMSIAVR